MFHALRALRRRNRNVESAYALFFHLDLKARMMRGMRFPVIRAAHAKYGVLDWNRNRQRGIGFFLTVSGFSGRKSSFAYFVFNWTTKTENPDTQDLSPRVPATTRFQ